MLKGMPRKTTHPNCYTIAGPTGAGKTTFATEFLPLYANCRNFINADMKRQKEPSLTQMAMRALTDAVAKVVEDHRRRNKPLAVWRDGKAVWISAEEAAVMHEVPPPYGRKAKI